jgi:hypothetical protein
METQMQDTQIEDNVRINCLFICITSLLDPEPLPGWSRPLGWPPLSYLYVISLVIYSLSGILSLLAFHHGIMLVSWASLLPTPLLPPPRRPRSTFRARCPRPSLQVLRYCR